MSGYSVFLQRVPFGTPDKGMKKSRFSSSYPHTNDNKEERLCSQEEVMKEIIKVNKETRQQLMKSFGISDRRVRMALRSERSGGVTPEVRKRALELGGRVQQVLDGIETCHEADGTMRQVFPNGVVLTIHIPTGKAVATHNGRSIGEWTFFLDDELMSIQAELSEL